VAVAKKPRISGKNRQLLTRYQKGPDAKKEQLEPPAGGICHCRSCCWSAIRDPIAGQLIRNIEHRTSIRRHRTSNIEQLAAAAAAGIDPAASNIGPAAGARDPIRLGHGPRGKGRFD